MVVDGWLRSVEMEWKRLGAAAPAEVVVLDRWEGGGEGEEAAFDVVVELTRSGRRAKGWTALVVEEAAVDVVGGRGKGKEHSGLWS